MAATTQDALRKDLGPTTSVNGEDGGGIAIAQSASLLIGLQVVTRLLTFALNQLLVRLTDPSVFGAANVQLDLLLSTILFLARDGVRGALIRTASRPAAGSGEGRTVLPPGLHNIALLPIPAGLAIASVATLLYITRLAPDELVKSYPGQFYTSVGLYVFGAVLELISEPFYNRASVSLNVGLRVKAEGAAVMAKGVATLAWMMAPIGPPSDKISRGLVAFGLGQAAYGAATLFVFLSAQAREGGWAGIKSALLPARTASAQKTHQRAGAFDAPTISLTWVLVKQSLLKHVLTESDKLAVARLGSLSDQGGYALASNYGSLVARMLFQPLEESSRIIFSTQLGSVQTKEIPFTPSARTAANVSRSALTDATKLLSTLLHFYALLAVLLLSFAPPLATPGLFLLAGNRWATSTSAPSILGSYAGIYLGVMGFNGILEGFLQATASEAELGTYSGVMIVSSAGFVAALAGFSHQGVGGEIALVYANSLALGLRALWSWRYVLSFVHKTMQRTLNTLSDDKNVNSSSHKSSSMQNGSSAEKALQPTSIIPSFSTLLIFAFTAVYLRYDSFDVWRSTHGAQAATLGNVLPFLIKGAACAVACLTSLAVFERQRIRSTLSTLRSRG
ncbi:Oligosaccharide translocation protein rft1 [Tilletia horrida]|nr:Oligosaccharide translocation protein rft1 [Tilletia horrida]